MPSVIVINLRFILLALLAQAHARKPRANQTGDAQDSMDKLADTLFDKMFDRVLKAGAIHHTGLDKTILAQTHLDKSHGITRPSFSVPRSPFLATRSFPGPVVRSAFPRSRSLPITHAHKNRDQLQHLDRILDEQKNELQSEQIDKNGDKDDDKSSMVITHKDGEHPILVQHFEQAVSDVIGQSERNPAIAEQVVAELSKQAAIARVHTAAASFETVSLFSTTASSLIGRLWLTSVSQVIAGTAVVAEGAVQAGRKAKAQVSSEKEAVQGGGGGGGAGGGGAAQVLPVEGILSASGLLAWMSGTAFDMTADLALQAQSETSVHSSVADRIQAAAGRAIEAATAAAPSRRGEILSQATAAAREGAKEALSSLYDRSYSPFTALRQAEVKVLALQQRLQSTAFEKPVSTASEGSARLRR